MWWFAWEAHTQISNCMRRGRAQSSKRNSRTQSGHSGEWDARRDLVRMGKKVGLIAGSTEEKLKKLLLISKMCG
jgi:hypothetical protein